MAYSKRGTQQRVSTSFSVAPPLGGINDIDPIAAMDPSFCLDLVNWFPSTGDIVTRSGYAEYAINLEGQVGTLMPFRATDGSEELFAATTEGIFDVTDKTDAPTKVVECSVKDTSFCQFATVSSTYLVVVNGQDSGWLYDGISWTQFSEDDPADSPGKISGIDPSKFMWVESFKRRLWFVEKDSLTAWYLPTDSIAGEAKPFYLGSIFSDGGFLKYIAPWSLDAGEDLEDRLMFASSTGELAIYEGTDPDNVDTWKLSSVFKTASPIGGKPYIDVGGDVLMLNKEGILPLSRVVSGEANAALFEATLTKRINRTLNQLINSIGYVDDWEIHNIFFLQAVGIVVPSRGDIPARQYVMNTLTGAWTKFDLPADCFSEFKGAAFFGSGDKVYIFGKDDLDNVAFDGSGGRPIQAGFFSAFNYMGNPGTIKHFKFVRPIFQTVNEPSYSLRLNIDFDLDTLPGAPPNPGTLSTGALWDLAIWDDALWSASNLVSRPWSGVSGLGYAAALLLRVAATAQTRLSALTLTFEEGAGL